MINSITAKLFETHLNTSIDLHPGVNTFVGESDEGKSGIVRMVRLNAQNRPRGDEYRNDQLDPKSKKDKRKKVEVGIDYKDSGLIVRERDGRPTGINHYVIDNEEPLRALRTDVPDEVQEITRMKKVNIQRQHPSEQYFLLADKPGQVAKEFNKVAGLTIMDKANSDVNSQIRTCKAKVTVAKEEVKTRKKEIKESEWIEGAEKFAEKLEKFVGKINKKRIQQSKINEVIIPLSIIDKELTSFKGLSDAKKELKLLKTQKIRIKEKKQRQNSIKTTLSALIDVDSIHVLDTDKALHSLKVLKTLKQEIRNQMKIRNYILVILSDFRENNQNLEIAEQQYKKAKAEYFLIREEQECPTCGRKGV